MSDGWQFKSTCNDEQVRPIYLSRLNDQPIGPTPEPNGFTFVLSLSTHRLSSYVSCTRTLQSESTTARHRLVRNVQHPYPGQSAPVTLLLRIKSSPGRSRRDQATPSISLLFSAASHYTFPHPPSPKPKRHAIDRLCIRHPQETRATTGQPERTAHC